MASNSLKKFKIILALGILFPIPYSLFSIPPAYAATPFALDWRANTYAPPGYEGKRLPGEGSTVLATITPLSDFSKNYYYKWYRDGVRQHDWAPGRTQFSFTALGRDANLEVKVGEKTIREVSFGRTVEVIEEVGSERAVIRSVLPQLVLFVDQNSTLVFQGKINLSPGTRTRFVAIPYFYNIIAPSLLRMKWDFMGNEVGGGDERPDELIFTIKEGAARIIGVLTARAEDGQGRRATSGIKVIVE